MRLSVLKRPISREVDFSVYETGELLIGAKEGATAGPVRASYDEYCVTTAVEHGGPSEIR